MPRTPLDLRPLVDVLRRRDGYGPHRRDLLLRQAGLDWVLDAVPREQHPLRQLHRDLLHISRRDHADGGSTGLADWLRAARTQAYAESRPEASIFEQFGRAVRESPRPPAIVGLPSGAEEVLDPGLDPLPAHAAPSLSLVARYGLVPSEGRAQELRWLDASPAPTSCSPSKC